MARRYYSSIAARTTLTADVTSVASTIAVAAVVGWPATFPYTLILDVDTVTEEIVTVTARSGTTITITRGVDESTASAHSAGAAVQHGVSARDFDEPNAFINGTGFVSPTLADAKGDLIVATADDTLARLAVGTNGHVVTADSGETGGMKWAQPGATPTQNPQTGTTYTFVLSDAGKTITASNASAQTYTLPLQSSVSWAANTQLNIVNIGAGTVTIAGAGGVTVTADSLDIEANKGGSLIRTASDAWTLIPFSSSSGVGAANFTDTATGTYTDGGIDYKYITFTGSGSLVVDQAGFADILCIGGGGGGGSAHGGAGAGGHLVVNNAYFPVGTLPVVVGAGGAGSVASALATAGANGLTSQVSSYFSVGGGGGAGSSAGASNAKIGYSGGSGGGAGGTGGTGGAGVSGQGNNGGNTSFDLGAGGGGAGAVGGNGASGVSGSGGAGLSNSITNVSVTRAGGGGGGGPGGTAGAGGSGGGGAGTNNNTTGGAGSVNLGGGGGGGGFSGSTGAGGPGGSGLVIVRVVV